MGKKKIAIVVGSFPTISETFIVNQIISIIKEGHFVDIIAFHKKDYKDLHDTIHQYDLINKTKYYQHVPKNLFRRLFYPFKWLKDNIHSVDLTLFFRSFNFLKFGKEAIFLNLFYKCQFFLFKEKYDIIHVHFGHNAIDIGHIRTLGFLDYSRLLVTFHGFDLIPNRENKYRKLYKEVYETFDAFTVNSIYLKNNLVKVFPAIQNIFILPVGLDTDYFKVSDRKYNRNKFKILFCGRLIELKGIELSIDILNELINRRYKNVELIVVGEGELLNRLKEKVDTLSLKRNVIFKGALVQKLVKTEMENSDVLILPGIKDPINSRAETQGLVVQEAQSMQLPVIVSDAGGIKYGMRDNISGFVIKQNDVQGFADKIERLILEFTLRGQMGKEGRQFVVKRYDSKILAEELFEIYDVIINSKHYSYK